MIESELLRQDAAVLKIADLLCTAWQTGQAARLQTSDTSEIQSLSEAQAATVQALVGERLGWWPAGALPLVWKSGAGSREQVLKHAPLPTPAVRQSAGGAPVSLAGLPWFAPQVEAEVALRLGQPVSPALAAELSVEAAWQLVEAMAPAIEVVDSRWQARGEAPALLQLADGQWHGALVLGDWQPAAALNWRELTAELWVNGAQRVAVTGAHPLGEPGWLLPQWLRHLTRHGATVPAGTIVTTGNWTGAMPWPAEADIEIRFETLGRVALARR